MLRSAARFLTLNRDYFRLDGGLERHLYQLARKHCGHQAQWRIALDLLHKKTGSRAPLKKFRQMFKRLTAKNALPDYRTIYDQDADPGAVCSKDSLNTLRDIRHRALRIS
jgi:plasmid replication initiation protein